MGTKRTELQRLELFLAKVQELSERRIFADGMPKISLQVAIVGPHSTKIEVPDKDDFDAFLVSFRPFTAKTEDLYFPGIHEILERYLTDDDLREANQSNLEQWNEAFAGDFSLVFGERRYEAHDLFRLIINGILFHHDHRKEAELGQLPEAFRTIGEFEVIRMALECAYVLRMQANVVRQALDRGAFIDGLRPKGAA